MNEQNQAPVAAKKGRGRPVDNNARRTLYLHTETFKAYGKGRIPNGTNVIEVSVHRGINSSTYVHGTTPVFSAKSVVIGANKAVVAAPANNVQAVVIEPAHEETVATATVPTLMQIPD